MKSRWSVPRVCVAAAILFAAASTASAANYMSGNILPGAAPHDVPLGGTFTDTFNVNVAGGGTITDVNVTVSLTSILPALQGVPHERYQLSLIHVPSVTTVVLKPIFGAAYPVTPQVSLFSATFDDSGAPAIAAQPGPFFVPPFPIYAPGTVMPQNSLNGALSGVALNGNWQLQITTAGTLPNAPFSGAGYSSLAWSLDLTYSPTVVPEPNTGALGALGMIGLFGVARRRRRLRATRA